jgi:hypothetical protein
MVMERGNRSDDGRVIISKVDWRSVTIEDTFPIPTEVVDAQAYIDREKIKRYLAEHPNRIYYYSVGDNEYTVDCKGFPAMVKKWMTTKGANDADITAAIDISKQFHEVGVIAAALLYKAKTGPLKVERYRELDDRAEELIDLFGKLHSIAEVHRIILQDWNLSVSLKMVGSFYNRNLKEIDRLRDQYALDYSDVSLSKKRARLDKRAIMFYTYYQKWQDDPRLDYAQLMLKILEQIEKEVEGERINVNIQGQINVDLTMEVNKTLFDAYKRVPVNNLIVALVAAKKGVDPTNLMTQLTTSYYRSLTGYGKYEPEKELIHPVDLTYNWNEIEQKHRNKDRGVVIEDAQIVESTGKPEQDINMQDVKQKLLAMLEKDRSHTDRRDGRK